MTTRGLVVENLTVGYRARAPILTDVGVTAERGEITAVIGANGSGKSTLLHALMGLVRPTAGRASLDGRPLAGLRRTKVGFCADDLPLPELLTGAEYLHVMSRIRDVRVAPAVMTTLFDSVNMAGAEHRLIKEFSHGMKRKVQLLANVVHSPELLVLDEPFRGLDPESHALVLQLLDSYVRSGRIVLLSTHDLGVAASLCRRAVEVERGCIRAVDLDARGAARAANPTVDETRRSRGFFAALDAVEAS